MKKQTGINFVKISKEHTSALTGIVSETIAMDNVPAKRFTTIDLWNIQRSSKSTRHKRRLV
jgi:hypothetical protein